MWPAVIGNPTTRVFRFTVIALGVSIPISTALDNLLLGLAWIAFLLSGQFRDLAKNINKIKYLWFAIGLFALLALGLLQSIGDMRGAARTLSKYADLMCIPLFVVAFRDHDTRMRALYAFAITIAVIVVLSYLIRFGLLPAWPVFTGDALSPTVFKLKITHNLLLAFGAFLFVWLAINASDRRRRLVWGALAVLAALNVLFLVQGATGYVTLAVLAWLLGSTRLGRRGTLIAALALVAVAAALLATPNKFRDRAAQITQEALEWPGQGAANTSIGLRLEFYANTLPIIAAHPLIGVGTGRFAQAYAEQVQGSEKVRTHNPHNEYLLIAAQVGIPGLALLLAMFWQQWRGANLAAGPLEAALTRGLVLTMVSGCLVNSFLLDHAEGLFYAWLSGLLCGGIKYASSERTPALA
ncbi:MAG: O-antigen ligase family protein [Betaproteobacteria bacterium]|nr:O-antigen ligase family protein [Betaproteobacteria bacterium]